MKNKQGLKFISFATLLTSVLSLLLGNQTPNIQTAQAAISPNEDSVAIVDLIDNPAGGITIRDISSDIDKDGNQYYTWVTDEPGSCHGLYYQVFNKAAVPVTQATQIDTGCAGAYNFFNPDIYTAADPSGNYSIDHFAIVYNKYTQATGSHAIRVLSYNRSYGQYVAGFGVDSGLILDETAQPRIAGDYLGEKVGITFTARDFVGSNLHNVYFQGYDLDFTPMHGSNLLVNSVTAGNQADPAISFSGEHFMVTFSETDTNPTPNTYVKARAINYTANNLSAEITVEAATNPTMANFSDVAGMLDNDYTANPLIEHFYVTYVYHFANADTEIRLKKIYCQYDSGNPGSYNCNLTSREGEPIYSRVNSSGVQNSKPAITSFKNTTDIKRFSPNENTNIDVLTVAWISNYNGTFNLKAQNYTDTLAKTGGEISVADNIYESSGISISSSRDGFYGITFKYNSPTLDNHAKLYPSMYLKRGVERQVNAPDSSAQENVKVAKNSDGKYVVTYQSFNGADYDVIYALYDQYGNAIKNTTLANQTTGDDQTNPQVAFWNEDSTSGDYGKFIISWEGAGATDADGIYYRIFNADGTPNSDETLVNQNTGLAQSEASLSTGKFGQFAVVYKESSSIILFYKNGTNNIYQTVFSGTAPYNPLVALSRMADGSTGSSGTSKFVITWDESALARSLVEGYLNSSSTAHLNSSQSQTERTLKLEGGYNSANATFTPAQDNFYYVRYVYLPGAPPTAGIKINFFGNSTPINISTSADEGINDVSIDPATQNIFTIGQRNAGYSVDNEQVLLFPSDAPSNLAAAEHITDEDLLVEADVLEGHGQYIFIENATGGFPNGTRIGEYILEFIYRDTVVYDDIGTVTGNFLQYSVNTGTNMPQWTKSGPAFAINHYNYYGQTFGSYDAAYDTRPTDSDGKFIATAYSTVSSPDYPDANGVLQQMIDDPFSVGTKEDLTPVTEQQVNPGGRYIIVPNTIDFGSLLRNTTGTVDFATLTPDCVSITDLDGTDFDLTVSLTSLINTGNPAQTLANSNFIIENNNSVNPPIVNLLPFSSISDVTLDPSTDPGENANLGTTRTLMRKSSFGTGAWEICPKAILNIPAEVESGTYSGTLTFTLI